MLKMRKIIIALFLSLALFQLTDFLAFRYIGNADINAFGPYSIKTPAILITITTALCLIVLCFLLVRIRHKFPLAVIIGAGISNLLDRFFYGGVVDYIKFFNISTINLADIAISISIAILLWLTIRDRSAVISNPE